MRLIKQVLLVYRISLFVFVARRSCSAASRTFRISARGTTARRSSSLARPTTLARLVRTCSLLCRGHLVLPLSSLFRLLILATLCALSAASCVASLRDFASRLCARRPRSHASPRHATRAFVGSRAALRTRTANAHTRLRVRRRRSSTCIVRIVRRVEMVWSLLPSFAFASASASCSPPPSAFVFRFFGVCVCVALSCIALRVPTRRPSRHLRLYRQDTRHDTTRLETTDDAINNAPLRSARLGSALLCSTEC